MEIILLCRSFQKAFQLLCIYKRNGGYDKETSAPFNKKRRHIYRWNFNGWIWGIIKWTQISFVFLKIAALSPSADCYDLICGHEEMFDRELFENVFGSEEKYYENDTNLCKFYSEVPKEEIPELLLPVESRMICWKGVKISVKSLRNWRYLY